MDDTVGVMGIGLMGFPIARRLAMVPAGGGALPRVIAWNRDPSKAAALIPYGVTCAGTIDTLAREAEVIVLSLADTFAVEEVITRLVPFLRAGQLILDFSSIEPAATRRLAAELTKLGIGWVDAPVSGGVIGAEKGTLAIMAGGGDADVARARHIASPLCQRFTHVGPVGSGQVVKVCNQMIVACNAVVLAEVVALAEAAGVDASKLPDALRGGFADSIPFQLLVPRMATREFEPAQWRVRTLLKDLDTAIALAGGLAATVPMSHAAAALFRIHASRGNEARDPSTLVELHARVALNTRDA